MNGPRHIDLRTNSDVGCLPSAKSPRVFLLADGHPIVGASAQAVIDAQIDRSEWVRKSGEAGADR